MEHTPGVVGQRARLARTASQVLRRIIKKYSCLFSNQEKTGILISACPHKGARGQLLLCFSDDVSLVILPISIDNFSIFFELSVHSLQSFSSLGLSARLSSRDCGVYKLSSPGLQ